MSPLAPKHNAVLVKLVLRAVAPANKYFAPAAFAKNHFLSSAAWAAASRATGIRKGLQLT
jgi:hypothetical protein